MIKAEALKVFEYVMRASNFAAVNKCLLHAVLLLLLLYRRKERSKLRPV